MRSSLFALGAALSLTLLGCPRLAADKPPAPASDGDTAAPEIDTNALYEVGRQLFEEHAPAEVKAQYAFPTSAQWDDFTARLQKALEGGSLEDLAAFEPEAKRALTALRLMPDYQDYADWLEERLDLMDTARQAQEMKNGRATAPAPSMPPPLANEKPKSAEGPEKSAAPAVAVVPYYDLWLERLQKRPKPARADEFIPLLKVIMNSEGVP